MITYLVYNDTTYNIYYSFDFLIYNYQIQKPEVQHHYDSLFASIFKVYVCRCGWTFPFLQMFDILFGDHLVFQSFFPILNEQWWKWFLYQGLPGICWIKFYFSPLPLNERKKPLFAHSEQTMETVSLPEIDRDLLD